MTKIEWASNTWNVCVGCSKVSEACTNCYAEKMALRLAHMALADIKAGRDPGRKRYYLEVVDLERRCWNGKIALVQEALGDPLRWRKPREHVFVISMGDLFHEDVPLDYIVDVFDIMAQCEQHTFILLTKRADRMFGVLDAIQNWDRKDVGWTGRCPSCLCDRAMPLPLPNVWGLVTAENQKQLDARVPILLQCPFVVRGVSMEPMLGPVDLSRWTTCACNEFWPGQGHPPDCPVGKLNWIIVGPETGPGAREMPLDSARQVRDQCIAAGVPFFFKRGLLDGQEWHQWPQ